MKLLCTLLFGFACACSYAAVGPLNILIQPVLGDASKFALTASGSSNVAPGSVTISGAIWTGSNFFTTIEDGASAGLSFGGQSVTTVRDGSLANASLEFVIENTIPGGSTYAFDGGTLFGSVTGGQSFATTFSLGSYTITDVFGMFGQSFEGDFGSLVVDDTPVVPEPSTYAAIFGIVGLGLVAWKRRRA